MDESEVPICDYVAYENVVELCQRFVYDVRVIHNSILDFEFDCHQAIQIVMNFTESLDIRAQAHAFLLEYKKEISLLAPFSYFVNCALQIWPLVQLMESDPTSSRNLYNYYNER
ncbi:unnamed protein product [Rodentolepis nana]|uniref:Uncharacterized protein n=1 Tax=Rodentolepis nana TaxID=102285 RepID=A0A0R3TPV8_RODNA|nr:unnamed protein product [Rodentolepis nana]